jgi:hypothetical protein
MIVYDDDDDDDDDDRSTLRTRKGRRRGPLACRQIRLRVPAAATDPRSTLY